MKFFMDAVLLCPIIVNSRKVGCTFTYSHAVDIEVVSLPFVDARDFLLKALVVAQVGRGREGLSLLALHNEGLGCMHY